jgi:hypothetical protein
MAGKYTISFKMVDSLNNANDAVIEVEIISVQEQFTFKLFDDSGNQVSGYTIDENGEPVLTSYTKL